MEVKSVNIVEAEEEEWKEYSAPVAKPIDDQTIHRLSRSFAHRSFESEAEARNWLFDTLEHWDKQSWSHIFGQEGSERNRWFADHFPLYQDRHGRFRLGKPLMTWVKAKRQAAYEKRKRAQAAERARHKADFERLYPGWPYNPNAKLYQEYLSNNTSDFSDGTSGGRSGELPSPGDAGTAVGLPDYKYIERTHQAKKERLRKLLARRDPGGVSKNPVDLQIRRSLRESEEEDILKELGEPSLIIQQTADGLGHREYSQVDLPDEGGWIGTIWMDDLSPKHKTTPTLKRIWTEFPWVAQRGMDTTRHRTKSEAVAHLKKIHFGEANRTEQTPEYWERYNAIHHEERAKFQAYLDQGGDPAKLAEELLEAIDDEDYKDVFPVVAKPFGYACRATEAYDRLAGGSLERYGTTKYGYTGKYFAHNTSKSTFTPYIGDARLYRKRSTWEKGWPEYFQKGLWEIVPVFHDPRKWGERALHADPPRRLYQKEAIDDDDIVKDVQGHVNITLDEFIKRYEALPTGHYGANTYFKYFWMPREVNKAIAAAEEAKLSTAGHVWTLIQFSEGSVLPGVISISPAILHDMEAFKVKGYVVTQIAGDMDFNVEQLVSSDVEPQIRYI